MRKLIANAKINLFLHATEKRNDGYCNLESLVCFSQDLYDELYFEYSDKTEVSIKGKFSANIVENDNLVTRVLNYFHEKARITLVKNIPQGAGLGGGSADAGTLIKFIDKPFDSLHVAKTIGADTIVCSQGQALYLSGIGDEFELLSRFPLVHAVVIFPNLHISTKKIFSSANIIFSKPLEDKPKKFRGCNDLFKFLDKTNNVFQNFIEKTDPRLLKLRLILENIPNARIVRMTGTGSAYFVLFEKKPNLRKILEFLEERNDSGLKLDVFETDLG